MRQRAYTTMTLARMTALAAWATLGLAGCPDDSSDDSSTTGACAAGELNCACTDDGTCTADGTQCVSGYCVPGGTTTCETGDEGCPCYPNDTCNTKDGVALACVEGECAIGGTGGDCDPGTWGADCSPCACVNGTCADGKDGDGTCTCDAGWSGPDCASNDDDCAPNPCLNGGTCSDEVAGFTCDCPAGFGGTTCETALDSCDPNPCLNGGTCALEAGIASCTCAVGFMGALCETNVDDCAPPGGNPCLNGGTCVDGVDAFTCECAAGWAGPTCETALASCDPNPCLNGGTCSDAGGTVTCACAAGYEGDVCETNIDECTPPAGNPCLNGGTCTDGVAGFSCACAAGYEGDTCETDIDDCDPNPCLNSGTCADGVASFTCDCPAGWAGDTCETQLVTCDPNPCLNGGTCDDAGGAPECTCAAGYQGSLCGTNTDDCAPTPCLNGGTCTDGVASYECACPAGYAGLTCETKLDGCDPNPCQNGGTCADDGSGGAVCTCPAGYDGAVCEVNIDECDPNPCANAGTCTDGVASFACACADGWSGDTCEVNIDECDPNPCANGGTCADGVNSFTCTCAAGYEGDTCETNIDECDPNPCFNAGTCTDGVASFSCTCADGWSGDTCETNVDECDPNPCANAGTCADGINSFTCACATGYEGDTCETNTDDCDPNPCANGGTCADGINNYTCTCATGYDGDTCDIEIDECDPNPCVNGGICTDGIGSFTCACADGYDGDTCADKIVPTTTASTETVVEDATSTLRPQVSHPLPASVVISITSQPTNGVATTDGTTLSYTPNRSWFGTDSLQFVASFEGADSAATTLDITVTNRPEVALVPTMKVYAIKADGTMWSWGVEDAQAADPPAGANLPAQVGTDSDWTALVGGTTHLLALKHDGSLWGWTRDGAGWPAHLLLMDEGSATTPTVPTLLDTSKHWVAIAAGNSASYGVDRDGNAFAWGSNNFGELGTSGDDGPVAGATPICRTVDPATLACVQPLTGVASITTGHYLEAAFATLEDGSLYGFGLNDGGELGLGSIDGDLSNAWWAYPVCVTYDATTSSCTQPLTNVVSVSVGHTGSAAVTADGSLWMWGTPRMRDLILSGGTQAVVAATQVANDMAWASVSMDESNVAAIGTDGSLWGWGINSQGQLGLGHGIDRTGPARAGLATDWQWAHMTDWVSMGIKTDGSLWVWGSRRDSALQMPLDLSLSDQRLPAPMVPTWAPETAVDVVALGSATGVVTDAGHLWLTGSAPNISGNSPVAKIACANFVAETITCMAPIQNILEATLGGSHVVARLIGGGLVTWGDNSRGQLGVGGFTTSMVPAPVCKTYDAVSGTCTEALSGVANIAASWDASYVVQSGTGAILGFGQNDGNVPLGDGTTGPDRDVPVALNSPLDPTGCEPLVGVATVAGARAYGVAAMIDGTAKTWGDSPLLVKAVPTTVCLLSDGGSCAGDVSGIVEVAGGGLSGGFLLARTTEGDVYAAGSCFQGQLGNGQAGWKPGAVPVCDDAGCTGQLTGTKALAAGGNAGYARASDGTLWSWGNNGFGELGTGNTTTRNTPGKVCLTADASGCTAELSNIDEIAAGEHHAVALTSDGQVWTWGWDRYGQLGQGTAWIEVPTILPGW